MRPICRAAGAIELKDMLSGISSASCISSPLKLPHSSG